MLANSCQQLAQYKYIMHILFPLEVFKCVERGSFAGSHLTSSSPLPSLPRAGLSCLTGHSPLAAQLSAACRISRGHPIPSMALHVRVQLTALVPGAFVYCDATAQKRGEAQGACPPQPQPYILHAHHVLILVLYWASLPSASASAVPDHVLPGALFTAPSCSILRRRLMLLATAS
jgi:hypothetical protein